MPEKPSWQTSTLSQAFIGSLIFYGAILLLVTVGLMFFKADVETAKIVVGWASAAETAVMSAYLTARKPGNGNGGTHVETPERPTG